MERRNDRIKEFSYRSWLVNEKLPLDATIEHVFDCGCTQITGYAIAYLVKGVGNNGEAFVERPEKRVRAAVDLFIVVGGKLSSKQPF